jgi:dTDP-4-amino-4,6-dideoxygalactose transaminase
MIPITAIDLPPETESLVLAVIRSGNLAQGARVAELEAAFADAIGVRHAVAVSNGTTALVAALETLDLEPGDEVVTSPFTFVATLNAILEVGAVARFADISPHDFCVRPDAIEAVITKRTRAVLPVHLYGQCADMPAIVALARDNGFAVVEDAAQAHGATVDGRAAGTWGIGCFSLYATKNVTTGEGGLITTDDDAVADCLRLLRNQGMRARYQYERPGHNYRMTDLHAAVGLPQIARLAEINATRRRNAERLTAGLKDCRGIRVPVAAPGREHVWHQYTVLVNDESLLPRDALAEALARAGVGSGIYYPRVVFDYDSYRKHDRVRGDLERVPVAVDIASRALSLPVHPKLTDDDIDHVCATVRALVGD